MTVTVDKSDALKSGISQFLSWSYADQVSARAQGIMLARQAVSAGLAHLAIPLLQTLHTQDSLDCECQTLLGFAFRQDQQLQEADAVFTRALKTHPLHPPFLFGLAQTRYELGLPSASLFADAHKAMPGNFDIIRNRAAAMASEGDRRGAEKLLAEALVQYPDWLDGHKVLSAMRWTSGDELQFARSYAIACQSSPQNLQLWIAWFSAIAQTRKWSDCLDILVRAEKVLGQTASTIAARFFVACESCDISAAEKYLPLTAHIQGDSINLCRIRYFIRQNRFSDASGVISPLLQSASATLFWPYQSILWRVQNDARAEWLDRPDRLIKCHGVDLTTSEYAELADVLRTLHIQQRPYLEQSVRGGTQTDRSAILRHELILQRTRSRWLEAIRQYIEALPAEERNHPLLGTARSQILIDGSWSVRLTKQGRNVPHTHPRGWLSTAFYISLPSPDMMGVAPAGHIAFGVPPEDLGLNLQPYFTIEPVVGQTVIFPSTMWHSTIPFDDGERLVLALDIRRPTW